MYQNNLTLTIPIEALTSAFSSPKVIGDSLMSVDEIVSCVKASGKDYSPKFRVLGAVRILDSEVYWFEIKKQELMNLLKDIESTVILNARKDPNNPYNILIG